MHQKISATEGGFNGVLEASDFLGSSVCEISDLNGDGISELAVGSEGNDDGASAAGAIWIIFLGNVFCL